MGVKKIEKGKIVARYVGDTYFDVHHVPVYEGYGKNRKMKSSSYRLFHDKHELNKSKNFKSIEEATKYAMDIFPTYNKKGRTFKEPSS